MASPPNKFLGFARVVSLRLDQDDYQSNCNYADFLNNLLIFSDLNGFAFIFKYQCYLSLFRP